MACIVLENNGVRRTVRDGEPYKLARGEFIAGVDANCEGGFEAVDRQTPRLQDEMSQVVGPGFGDWIKVMAAPIAEVMGKKGCTTCEARRIVTNAYAKLKAQHGQLKALAMIKDLWALSYKADGDQVLLRLKELLRD